MKKWLKKNTSSWIGKKKCCQMSNWHCLDTEGVLMCFLLSDSSMHTVVLNRAESMRVLSYSNKCDTSFGWIDGEAPSENAGEPCSFTDNVKGVLMHGLSWYQFKEHHGYFNFRMDSSGLDLQNKIISHVYLLTSPALTHKLVQTEQIAPGSVRG